MSTTRLGKILVMLFGALSLMFLAWAFALWHEPPGWPPIVKERSAAVTKAYSARDQALVLFTDAAKNVRELDQQRGTAQKWYADQLRMMENGKDPTPVKLLAYEAGRLKIDKTGKPTLGEAVPEPGTGKPLQSLDYYLRESSATWATIQEHRKKIDDLIAEDKKLDTEINGPAGLRVQLAGLQQRLRNALDEELYLRPLVYNRQVEGQLLSKRRQQLEARLKELGSSPAERTAQVGGR